MEIIFIDLGITMELPNVTDKENSNFTRKNTTETVIKVEGGSLIDQKKL